MIEPFITAISSLQKKIGKSELTLEIIGLSKDVIINILPFYISESITLLTSISSTQVINMYGTISNCLNHIIDAKVYFDTTEFSQEKSSCDSSFSLYIKENTFEIIETDSSVDSSIDTDFDDSLSQSSGPMGIEFEGTLSQYDIYEEEKEFPNENPFDIISNANNYLIQERLQLY